VILHLILLPDKMISHKRLLRLWVTCCNRTLIRNGLQDSPVLFLLDECGNLGEFKLLHECVFMLCGYGARYVFILQSLAQFKEMFGEADTTVRARFDCTVFFGLRDRTTAEQMSKTIGTTTVLTHNQSHSTSTTEPSIWSGERGGSRTITTGSTHGTSETGRALIMEDEILRASERTVFVLPSRAYPIRVTQNRYYEDPEMSAALKCGAEPADVAPVPPNWPTAVARTEPVTDVDWAAITHPDRPPLPPLSEDVDWAAITHPCPTATPDSSAEPALTRKAEHRIRFSCPCGKRYNLALGMAGKRAQCSNPNCTRRFVIPGKQLPQCGRSAN
jgi:type IV secretory pathway TraG/TraD family ATPase VirD4